MSVPGGFARVSSLGLLVVEDRRAVSRLDGWRGQAFPSVTDQIPMFRAGVTPSGRSKNAWTPVFCAWGTQTAK